MGLSRAERSFLQCMMGAGALPERKAAALYNSCVENANMSVSEKVGADGRGLAAALGRVNTYLGAYELQFCAALHAKETHWGLANTGRDDAVKQATLFSPAELSFFFSLKDRLLLSDGSVALIEAQNLGPELKLRVADAARAISRLVALQWLRVVRRGGATVEFGARSLLELPDVRVWARKKNNEEVLKEELMSDGDRGTGGADLELEVTDEEMAEEEEEEPSQRRPSSRRAALSRRTQSTQGTLGSQPSASQRPKTRRRRNAPETDADDDEDEDDVAPSQTIPRRVTRGRAGRGGTQDDEVTVVRSKSGRRKRRVR